MFLYTTSLHQQQYTSYDDDDDNNNLIEPGSIGNYIREDLQEHYSGDK